MKKKKKENTRLFVLLHSLRILDIFKDPLRAGGSATSIYTNPSGKDKID